MYTEKEVVRGKCGPCSGIGGPVYVLGIVGALYYFFPLASGGLEILIAIGKSIVWPAFLVFKLFGI
jgi:hypothetical protein